MDFIYDAFISYRHTEHDMIIAEQLHKLLETYRIPSAIVKEGFPTSLKRIFRDREELPTAVSLSDSIKYALENSNYMIVICSTQTPKSKWVEKEVQTFIEMGRQDKILTILIEGTPQTSFPKSLLSIKDSPNVDISYIHNRKLNLKELRRKNLYLVAQIIGCDHHKLENEHSLYKVKQLIYITASILSIIGAFGLFSLYQWRQAEEARSMSQKQGQVIDKMINNLTYDLPDRIGNIPGTSGIMLQILEENLGAIDQMMDMGADPIAQQRRRIANFERIGGRCFANNDYDKALAYYKKALNIGIELHDNDKYKNYRGLILDYYNIGWILTEQGKLEESWDAHQKALALAQEQLKNTNDNQSKYDLSVCYQYCGDVKKQMGDIDKSYEYYNKAMEICKELSKDKSTISYSRALAVHYGKLADIEIQRRNYEEAKKHLVSSIQIREEIAKDKDNIEKLSVESGGGHHPYVDLAKGYYDYGNLLMSMNDYTGSIEQYSKALELISKLGDVSNDIEVLKLVGYIYGQSGEAHRYIKDYNAALSDYNAAIQIYENLAERTKDNAQFIDGIARYYTYAANIKTTVDKDFVKAEELYKKSIGAYADNLKKNPNENAFKALFNKYTEISINMLYYGRKDRMFIYSDEAWKVLKQNEELLGKSKDYYYGQYYLNASVLELANNDAKASMECGKKSVEYFTKMNASERKYSRELANAYSNLSFSCIYGKAIKESVEYSEKAVALAPDYNYARLELANTYLFDNQYEKAKEIYMSMKDEIIEGNIFTNLKNLKVFTNESASVIIIEEFKGFQDSGISHPDMVKIEKLLLNKK